MISEAQIQQELTRHDDVCPLPALRIPDESLIAQEMKRNPRLERRHCIGRIQVLAAWSKSAKKARYGRYMA